jgi:hypothetical protein
MPESWKTVRQCGGPRGCRISDDLISRSAPFLNRWDPSEAGPGSDLLRPKFLAAGASQIRLLCRSLTHPSERRRRLGSSLMPFSNRLDERVAKFTTRNRRDFGNPIMVHHGGDKQRRCEVPEPMIGRQRHFGEKSVQTVCDGRIIRRTSTSGLGREPVEGIGTERDSGGSVRQDAFRRLPRSRGVIRHPIEQEPASERVARELLVRRRRTLAASVVHNVPHHRVFFAGNPQRVLPQAHIRLLRFDVPFSRRRERSLPTHEQKFTGSATKQIRDFRTFIAESAFFKTYQFRDPAGGFREELEYPLIAIDEAIVNAVAHRDYAIQTPIQARNTPMLWSCRVPARFASNAMFRRIFRWTTRSWNICRATRS